MWRRWREGACAGELHGRETLSPPSEGTFRALLLLLPSKQALFLSFVLLLPLPLQQFLLLLRVEERLGLLERESLGLRAAQLQVAAQSGGARARVGP